MIPGAPMLPNVDPLAPAKPVAADSRVDAARISWSIRASYNPLLGFSAERLIYYLSSFNVGYLRDTVLLWQTMIRRDLMLKSVVLKRYDALASLQWKIERAGDSPEAIAQEEALKAFYANLQVTHCLEQDQRGGVSLLIRQCAEAIGLKYAAHEILWRPGMNGQPTSAMLVNVPAWFFECRTGRLRYLPFDYAIYGEDLEPGHWMITCGEGLMEASSVVYFFKHVGLGAWLSFVEQYGLPKVHAKTTAAQNTQQWDDAVAMLQNFAKQLYVLTDPDTTVDLLESQSGAGNQPHPPLVAYCDQSYFIGWRGSDLGTQSKGGQAVGASVQEDEGDLLLRGDAARISESLHLGLDAKVREYLFGPAAPDLARFVLVPPQHTNVKDELAVNAALVAAGAQLPLADELARFGRREAQGGEAVLQLPVPPAPAGKGEPEAQLTNRAANPAGGDGREELAAALYTSLAGTRARLAQIAALPTRDEQLAALGVFRTELAGHLREMGARPETTEAIARASLAAFHDSLTPTGTV